MRRLWLVALWVILGIGAASAPAAANSLCASIPITTLPPAPLTNANLTCDSNGNLLVNVVSGSGITPYSGTYGQALIGQSFLGAGGVNASTGLFDAWTFGPSATTLALGTPGVPYIQGIGPYGTVGVSGSLSASLPMGFFTLATAQPVPGPTSTATPPPNGIAVPVGGSDYSSGSASLFNPLKVNSSGQASVVLPTTQPVQIQNGANVAAVDTNGVTSAKTCDATTSTQCVAVNSSGAASSNLAYVGGAALGAAAAIGSSPTGNVLSVQGVASGTLIGTNTKQIASTTLGTPTAQGSVPTGVMQPVITHLNSSGSILANACDKSASVSITTATTTQIVALVASQQVRVCAIAITLGASTTAVLEYGTGTNCGTGTTALSGAFAATTMIGNGLGQLFATASGDALCLLSTGTGGIQGFITYAQY